jgi:hypothetical protein
MASVAGIVHVMVPLDADDETEPQACGDASDALVE